MYKYTIIMPVYNSESFLNKSIESVINQTYENWELIAIDDGSKDNSYGILQEYSKKDKRIKIFHQDNVGPGKTRNFGIEQAKGDFIAFIDADDYYEKDFLELVNNENLNNKNDLIFINTINEKKDGTLLYCDNLDKFEKYSKQELLELQMMGIMPWGPCSKIIKKEIIKQCYFSELEVGEEAIYSFNVLNRTSKYVFIKKPLYHYVHNDNGQHTKGGYDPWGPVVEYMKKYLINIGEYNKYEMIINGLALKALSIIIYRYSCSLKIRDAIKKIDNTVNDYKKKYDFKKINYRLIDKKLKMIILFIKLKLYLPLILASKLRKKIY